MAVPHEQLSAAAINYRPRIIGCLLFAAMLASLPLDDLERPRMALIALCAVWPHFAFWAAWRRGASHHTERLNVLGDFLLGGFLIAACAFRLWPVAAIVATGVINGLLFGGPKFLVGGVAVTLAALAVGWATLRPAVHLDTEPLATALSLATILAYIVLIGSTAYRLRLRQREMRAALEREERRSHELLVNVFPEAIVPRLRAGESPIADQYADVTVVFADIVEFTPLAERLGPKRTVLLLNDLFQRFDHAAARFGVEKIETTGDGYLAVAGAPTPLGDHAGAAADFALAAIEAASAVDVPIRVGIHTGPIFGGVIGESRFHYKVFGDTVNTASRVQGQATPGRTLVSDTTARRIQGTHALEERGTIDLKGHGPMRTWWLAARKA